MDQDSDEAKRLLAQKKDEDCNQRVEVLVKQDRITLLLGWSDNYNIMELQNHAGGSKYNKNF